MMMKAAMASIAALWLFSPSALAQWDDDPPEEPPRRMGPRPGKAPADEDLVPPARVEFVESVDAKTVMLSCDGDGADQPAAILAARWNCLAGFIDKFLALTPEQKKAFEQAAPAFRADLDRYVSKPPPGSADGRGRGVKSMMRVSDTRVRTTIVVALDFVDLVKELEKKKVLSPTSPMTFTVKIKGAKGAGTHMVQATLVERLVAWGMEVKDPASKGASPDLGDLHMAESGLVLELDMNIEKESRESVAATVALKVIEPASGRIVGQSVVTGPPRLGSQPGAATRATVDALNDALFQIWAQLMAYQARRVRDGSPLRVEWIGIDLLPQQLLDVLNRHCRNATLLPAKGKDIGAVARCLEGKYQDVAGALKDLLDESKYENRYQMTVKSPGLIRIEAGP
jgi:hypothetical protein